MFCINILYNNLLFLVNLNLNYKLINSLENELSHVQMRIQFELKKAYLL